MRRFWECIGNRDVEGYLATFAEGAIAYDPVNGPPLSSTDDRRAFIEGMLGNFPKIEARIDFLTPCGDHVAAKWTVDAVTNSGDAARIEGIDTYRHAADGRISEMWGYFQI